MLHVEQTADHCIKCNICNTVCPVSAVTDLFPGPKYEGPQGQRFRAGIDAGSAPEAGGSPDHSLDYCSACGLCTQACPEGVMVAEINQIARSHLVAARGGLNLRDRIISRPSLMGLMARPVAPIANVVMAARPVRVLVEKTIGVHRGAAMPRFSAMTLRSWARSHKPPADATRSVAYFHGCAAQEFEPEVGAAVVRVLERNGARVTFPKQGCCGLPLQSNGIFDDARGYVRRLARTLAPHARAGVDIVGTATSCTLMLKREAREILGMGNDPELRAVSDRVYDICEYLMMLHDRGELRTDFAPLPITVTYHAPCQQQGHGIGKPALDLMALIPDLRVIETDALCCGIAGTYGLKREKYDISAKVGEGLFNQISAAQPELSVCDSETCRWHIERATGVRTVHPIEILHRAAGLG